MHEGRREGGGDSTAERRGEESGGNGRDDDDGNTGAKAHNDDDDNDAGASSVYLSLEVAASTELSQDTELLTELPLSRQTSQGETTIPYLPDDEDGDEETETETATATDEEGEREEGGAARIEGPTNSPTTKPQDGDATTNLDERPPAASDI